MVLEGAQALSPFRLERLQSQLQAIAPDVKLLGAYPVYWVQPQGAEVPDEMALGRILQASVARAPLPEGAVSRFVSPRLGTLSPWASKATELLLG